MRATRVQRESSWCPLLRVASTLTVSSTPAVYLNLGWSGHHGRSPGSATVAGKPGHPEVNSVVRHAPAGCFPRWRDQRHHCFDRDQLRASLSLQRRTHCPAFQPQSSHCSLVGLTLSPAAVQTICSGCSIGGLPMGCAATYRPGRDHSPRSNSWPTARTHSWTTPLNIDARQPCWS